MHLLQDVAQRRRKRNTLTHREAEAIGLTWTMVGVLADDYDLDFIKRTAVKGAEYVATRGVDYPTAILTPHEGCKLLEIGLRELLTKYLLPIFCHLYLYHNMLIFLRR